MVMRMMRQGAAGGITKFILFGFLVLAVGGLVLMDVGGFFRGGVGGNDVARIGSEKVSIVSFDRAVRRALSRVGISPQEALKLGYINEILGTEIRTSLLHNAAKDLGVQVGKNRIAHQVNSIIAPMVEQGQEPQAVLDQVLRAQGMTEREFVRAIDREMAGSILGQAVQGGFAGTPHSIARDMYMFNNEKRNIELVVLTDKDTKDVKPPSEEQLTSMYESLKENFATPETRKVSLAFVPDAKKTVEVPEEEIRAAYDEGIDSYAVP
jgi:peptidyl-prolyl cis-trans isomerase D